MGQRQGYLGDVKVSSAAKGVCWPAEGSDPPLPPSPGSKSSKVCEQQRQALVTSPRCRASYPVPSLSRNGSVIHARRRTSEVESVSAIRRLCETPGTGEDAKRIGDVWHSSLRPCRNHGVTENS